MYCPDDEYDSYTDYFFTEIMWQQHTVDHVISVNQLPPQDTKIIVECTRNKAHTPNDVTICEEEE